MSSSASTTRVSRSTKFPNRGWMTLRLMPMWPRPASTATVLWEISQTAPLPHRPASMGNPTEVTTARAPRRWRARAISWATVASRSPSWWKAVFAIERGGDTRLSRLVAITSEMSVRAPGSSRSAVSRWVPSAARSTSTNPTSSAPSSRHNSPSRAALRRGGAARGGPSASRRSSARRDASASALPRKTALIRELTGCRGRRRHRRAAPGHATRTCRRAGRWR